MSQQIIDKILSNTATPAEKNQFEEWLNASADNRKYFNKARVVWDNLEGAFSTKKFDKNQAQLNIDAKISAGTIKTFKFKRRRQIAFAATFLILIGLSYFVTNKIIQSNQFSIIYTATDSILKVDLKDGSQVWLNKNSTLKLPENFSLRDRIVYLKGEAYFEVARDEARPFKVMAGKTITRVLGTSFDIEMDTLTHDVNLNVNSGKVTFSKRYKMGNKYTLTVGAYAQYIDEENRIMVGKNESLNVLSWKTRELKFYDTPISEVCKDLSKFYGVDITSNLSDETILTGTFNKEKLEDVMAIIKLSLGIEISEDDGKYTLTK